MTDKKENEEINEIDKKFDQAEKVVERSGKLILKIVGGFVGIALAVALAWQQIDQAFDENKQDGYEEGFYEDYSDEYYPEDVYIVDSFKEVNLEGDTVIINLWSDGTETEEDYYGY